ncbi:MAG: hydroxyacid dehydrogenase [Candidatus Nomurabacteria bacterium]|jgi:D-lactate dehydrogenase|nr:hydroxyacid dehydrogenase [Candidatus Nomurabacteria bacterium]
MKKVGFIGCSVPERHFYEKALPDLDLVFYDISDDYRGFDKDIRILSVFTNYNVTADVINHLPRLELIACRSTGYNHIDLTLAKKRGVRIANAPGYGRQAVAEYVFALLLNLSRKVKLTIEEEDGNDPIDRARERGFNLFGKTIGIVGLGSVGQGVAQIAHGFGMNVMAYDPLPDSEFAQRNHVELADDVETLLKKSDIVTLHVPFSRQQAHFIDEARLETMKKSAILINTARGELVDTVALVTALRNGDIAGAALDVVEDEYLLDPAEFIRFASEEIDENRALALRHATAILALERLDNAIVTNHNAYNTVEAIDEIANMTVENIKGYISGGKVCEVQI